MNSASRAFYLISCCIFAFGCLVMAGDKPLAPALYVFGDSLFDSGNNNFLPTVAKADFLPYGANFGQGRSTGRFTNGKTLPDFIADFLDLPYSPPYLSMRGSVPITGLNYASGSCGILPESGSTFGRCLSLEDQINMFQRTVKSELPTHFNSSNGITQHLSKSIFLISTGNNDYINNYLDTKMFDTSKRYNPQQFAQILIDALSHHLETLYNLGVRKVVMFEIGPIGCLPSVAKTHQHEGQCDDEPNRFVSYFNAGLEFVLTNLTSTLQGSMFVLGHGHWLGYDAVLNPSNYGLIDSINPCCKTWANGTSGCIPWLNPCPNPENHYFWDAYHLTETIYSIIASRCINSTSVCLPVNIKDLVQM